MLHLAGGLVGWPGGVGSQRLASYALLTWVLSTGRPAAPVPHRNHRVISSEGLGPGWHHIESLVQLMDGLKQKRNSARVPQKGLLRVWLVEAVMQQTQGPGAFHHQSVVVPLVLKTLLHPRTAAPRLSTRIHSVVSAAPRGPLPLHGDICRGHSDLILPSPMCFWLCVLAGPPPSA